MIVSKKIGKASMRLSMGNVETMTNKRSVGSAKPGANLVLRSDQIRRIYTNGS